LGLVNITCAKEGNMKSVLMAGAHGVRLAYRAAHRVKRWRRGGVPRMERTTIEGSSPLVLWGLRSDASMLRGPCLPTSVALDVGVRETESHIKSLALLVVSFYVIDTGYNSGVTFNAHLEI